MRPTPITMQPPGTAVLSAAASATGSAAPPRSTISRSRSRGQSPIASAASIVPSRMLALPSVTLKRSAEMRAIAVESETNAMALIADFSSPADDAERCWVAVTDMARSVRRARRSATAARCAAGGPAGIECAYLALAITGDCRGIDRGVGRSSRATDRCVARPCQHLAQIVGVGAAEAWHDGLVGVGAGGRTVGRTVVDPEQILGAHDDDRIGTGRHGRLDGGADPARACLGQALADPLGAQALDRAARAIRHDDELVALGAPASGDHGPEFVHLAGVRRAGAGREIDGHHGVGAHGIEARVGGGLLGDGVLRAGRQASGGHEHDDGSHGHSYSTVKPAVGPAGVVSRPTARRRGGVGWLNRCMTRRSTSVGGTRSVSGVRSWPLVGSTRYGVMMMTSSVSSRW